MTPARKRILLFGYLPPPVFGQSVAYENLLRSEFGRHFDITFINLTVVKSIRELERFHPAKLVKLAKFYLLELWYLMTRRFALCCYPIAYNRNAFRKDAALLGLARAFGVPTVLWAHGTGVHRFRDTLPGLMQRRFDRMLGEAAAVFVLADCLHDEFEDFLPPERIHTVTIGLEPQTVLPPRQTVSGQLRIVYLGALVKTKGVFDLLAALPLVLERCPNARLLLAGEWYLATEQAEAEEFIRQHNLQKTVEFVGPVHDQAKWRLLRSADLFVFPPPAAREAFGIVLLEAMQAGLPIVATRGGARNDVVTEGINGLLANENDPRDLADKIQQLLTEPALRERMSAANQERFTRLYTHETYGQRMIELLEACMSDRTPEPAQAPTTPRTKLLMIGYLPPPYFGPSVTYKVLMRSEFARRFDVSFIDITVVDSISEIEHFRIGKLFTMFGFLLRELRLLMTRRFDFCCCPVAGNRNAFVKDALLFALARWFGVPTVMYAHGNNLPDFHARSPAWLQRLIERTATRAAAAIVLGEALRFNFEKWLPPERIFVVPTGIEPPDSMPARPPHKNGVTVLYLGNLMREKGVFVLLEAAAAIATKRDDTRFVFTGVWLPREDEPVAKQFIATHHLEKRTTFTGPVVGEAKWRLLAEADIVVFPTFHYYETMGLVLLEAMHAGLPVVTTRRAAIPEMVHDGVNGLLVEEQNAYDLADKILRLASDPALREQMGRANLQRFAEFYTHEQYAQRMINVFETLARNQPTRG